MKITLKDGVVLDNIKMSLEFALDIDEDGVDKIEVHIQGSMEDGWYSNLILLEDLSRVFEEEDLVKVKFMLGKINGVLRVK
jgi:hypothetical protein